MGILEILIALVALLVGLIMGWIMAHKTVAKECNKLGGFYVGKNVYKVTLNQNEEVKSTVRRVKEAQAQG